MFRVYESNIMEGGMEIYFVMEWSLYFFKSGIIKNYLKGYCKGKVEYEILFVVRLYECDFLGIEWGIIVL